MVKNLPANVRRRRKWQNPLQCSCLEDPRDRGAWWAAVYGVAQSWTRLKRLSMRACIGEGNGNPLQCSCLEDPRDGGAWWAAVHGVSQSWTRLKWPSMRACIGEGNGNPLQCSCLEDPRDRGACWAAVCGVSQSRTRLKRLSSSSSTQCRRHKRHGFNPWVWKIAWRRKWQPTPVFPLGESPGQRSLEGYSSRGCKESDRAGRLST